MFKRSLLLLTALLLPALTGCDTLTDSADAALTAPEAAPADAQSKLRHWDLLETAAAGAAHRGDGADADSVDFILSFANGVTDPVLASEIVFSTQGVKTRTYFRDTFTGVAATISTEELDAFLDEAVQSDLVESVEPDVTIVPPPEDADYIQIGGHGDDDDDDDGDDDGDRQGFGNVPAFYAERMPFEAGPGAMSRGGDDDDDDDRRQLLPWNVQRIGGDRSSARSGNGWGRVDVDVYVIDGPIRHPDLNVVERVNLLPAGTPSASTLHGTHVAGTIAALDNRQGVVGVAPGARIHSLEVLDADGAAKLSVLVDAVELVTQRKLAAPDRPIVVNISLGVDLGSTAYNALDEAVESALEAGVVVVVSAGNGGVDAATYSPAHVEGAITVGAYTGFHFLAPFSNYGRFVDLLAPGAAVVSTADGGRYAKMSGTSMAAPHVTGVVALYLDRHPAATPAQVRAQLVQRSWRAVWHVPPSTTLQGVAAHAF